MTRYTRVRRHRTRRGIRRGHVRRIRRMRTRPWTADEEERAFVEKLAEAAEAGADLPDIRALAASRAAKDADAELFSVADAGQLDLLASRLGARGVKHRNFGMAALYQPARREWLEKYPMITPSGQLLAQTKQRFTSRGGGSAHYYPKLTRSAHYFDPFLDEQVGRIISGVDLTNFITLKHPSYEFKAPVGALQTWHDQRHAADQRPDALQTRWTGVRPIRPEERFLVTRAGPSAFTLIPQQVIA